MPDTASSALLKYKNLTNSWQNIKYIYLQISGWTLEKYWRGSLLVNKLSRAIQSFWFWYLVETLLLGADEVVGDNRKEEKEECVLVVGFSPPGFQHARKEWQFRSTQLPLYTSACITWQIPHFSHTILIQRCGNDGDSEGRNVGWAYK